MSFIAYRVSFLSRGQVFGGGLTTAARKTSSSEERQKRSGALLSQNASPLLYTKTKYNKALTSPKKSKSCIFRTYIQCVRIAYFLAPLTGLKKERKENAKTTWREQEKKKLFIRSGGGSANSSSHRVRFPGPRLPVGEDRCRETLTASQKTAVRYG